MTIAPPTAADLAAAAQLLRAHGGLEGVAGLLERLAVPAPATGPATAPLVPGGGGDEVRIVVRDMVVELRIGIHPWERHQPQRVIVNVEMFAPAPAPHAWQELGDVLDYDRIRNRVKGEWPTRPHVDFLETYVEELLALCFEDGKCAAARVSITKPDIFPETAAVGVEVFRRRQQG